MSIACYAQRVIPGPEANDLSNDRCIHTAVSVRNGNTLRSLTEVDFLRLVHTGKEGEGRTSGSLFEKLSDITDELGSLSLTCLGPSKRLNTCGEDSETSSDTKYL